MNTNGHESTGRTRALAPVAGTPCLMTRFQCVDSPGNACPYWCSFVSIRNSNGSVLDNETFQFFGVGGGEEGRSSQNQELTPLLYLSKSRTDPFMKIKN